MKLKNTPEEFISEYKQLCHKYKMHLDIMDEFNETMDDGSRVYLKDAPFVTYMFDEEYIEEFDILMDMAILTTYTIALAKYKLDMVSTCHANQKIMEIMEKYRDFWEKDDT